MLEVDIRVSQNICRVGENITKYLYLYDNIGTCVETRYVILILLHNLETTGHYFVIHI